MAALRKIIVLFAIVFMALGCYAEEQKTVGAGADAAGLSAKVAELEGKLEKLAKGAEEMQEQIDKLAESNGRLAKGLRNLELATQFSATTRPDMDTWKKVKKGMSYDEVLNLLGNPERMEMLGNSDVWYYFGMGSITFDRSGRMNSQSTFKQLPLERDVR
ncbi:MAG: outer membrane protein assembly factor BamE [Candidatus Omnitrophica bacterium]|nr:outer membrane protein assembly factor BamE [Candidatus Omnitrophota bacterium]